MLMPDNTHFVPVENPDMTPVRTPNQRISMEQRLGSFDPIDKTYTEEEALHEAGRCLKCPTHWCQKKCPAGVPVTDFIARVRAKDYEGAYQLIRTASTLPEICSRVCPQEKQCQSDCTRSIRGQAVGIGRLERFVTEWHYAHLPQTEEVQPTGRKVAVVGSGPSGLSAAQRLADLGHSVTVLERSGRAGGLLENGIPNMKLEKGVVERKIAALQAQGVEIRTGACVDSEEAATALQADYDAVVLCVGTGNARKLAIGEADGIYGAVDFLSAATGNLLDGTPAPSAAGKNVIVLGGGDTGNDCLGTVIRQGCASVTQIEMLPRVMGRQLIYNPYPAPVKEQKFDTSQEECLVRFCRDPHLYQTTVKSVETDAAGKLCAVTAVSLQAETENGRLVMQEIPGTEVRMPCELLVIAAGFLGPDPDIAKIFGLETTDRSNLATTDYATSAANVFACGDCRTGQSLVVRAMADGRDCADRVDAFLAAKG